MPAHPWESKLFTGLMLLCVAFFFWFAAVRILSFDELLCYFTESVPTASALLRVQSNTPVSLDPPLYHLIGHWVLGLGLNPAWSIRFFPLAGGLTMLTTIYWLTRRIAGLYPAMLSVVTLALFMTFYIVEARPYGVLLGASGLSLLCWSNAVHRLHRAMSLAGLAIGLALAISCHYFGILVPVPLLLAEAYRSFRHGKIDRSVSAVLLGSYAAALSWLPFLRAAHTYKASYYTHVHWIDICRAYVPFAGANLSPVRALLIWVLWLLIVAALIAAHWILRRDRESDLHHDYEWFAVTVFAFLPILGVALASAASGAFESRYVIEFSVGVATLLCSAVCRLVPSRPARMGLLIAGFCVLGVRVVQLVQRNKLQAADMAESWKLVMQAHEQIVLTDNTEYARFYYYHRGDTALKNISWVSDMNREVSYSGSDNIDRTFLNLRHFTTMQVVDYESVSVMHRPSILVSQNIKADPPSWLVAQINASHMTASPVSAWGNHRIDRVVLKSQ